MKCIRCRNEVKNTTTDGYEVQDGGYIHHGCAMLMDKMPPKKMAAGSLKDLLKLREKGDRK